MFGFDREKMKESALAMAAAIVLSAASLSIAVAPAVGTPNTVQAAVSASPANS